MNVTALAVAVGVLGGLTLSHAEINCAQVNRYLQTGRSVQDVSETMVIPEDQVKKCQEQAAKGEGGGQATEETAEKKE